MVVSAIVAGGRGVVAYGSNVRDDAPVSCLDFFDQTEELVAMGGQSQLFQGSIFHPAVHVIIVIIIIIVVVIVIIVIFTIVIYVIDATGCLPPPILHPVQAPENPI